jgi:hypothetical protein
MTGAFRPGGEDATHPAATEGTALSVNRLLRTATQWRTALTPTSTIALVGAAGTAIVVALVVAASHAGVPQAVQLPKWLGAWPTGGSYRPVSGAMTLAVVAALCVVWVHLARTWLQGASLPRVRSILLVSLAWAVPFSLSGPIGSLDVQSYAAVGRLAQVGMDPYRYGPMWLHGPFAAAVSPEWSYTPTPYGPLQVSMLREIAVAAGSHVGLAVLMIRAVAIVGLAVAVVLAMHAAAVRERAWVLLLVALNPLVLVHVVSGAHLDILVGALALAVVMLVRKGHSTWAMAAAVAACMIKLPGLFLVGYVGLDVLRRTDTSQLRMRLAQVLGAAAAVVLATVAFVPDAFGWIRALSVPGTITSGLAPSTWVSWLLEYAGGVSDAHATMVARVLVAMAGGLVAARLLWHATEGPERSAYFGVGWGLLAIAFSGPTAYPWYITWGLFVAAVGSRARGRFALLAISVMYALLGAWGGGAIGMVTMLGSLAVAGVFLWRTVRTLVAVQSPASALAAATV